MLDSDDFKTAHLFEIKSLLKQHETFESDLSAHQTRVETIAKIAQELNDLAYSEVDDVNTKCQGICSEWDQLGDLTVARTKNLKTSEKVLIAIDELYLEYRQL